MTEVVGEALVELRGDKRRLIADIGSAGKESGGRFSRAFGSATARLGAVAGAAAVAGFVGSSVKLEAAYSKTMNVLEATSGASAAEMEALDDLALKMGADTVFSAGEAGKAMLELARGGIRPAQIEAGALEAAMTLAAAGELEMGDAANTVVQAMGAFSLEAEDAGAAAAALAGGANASSASVDDMRQALAQAGSGAAAAGLTIQETTAALAAFSNAGIQGSDAGTSLKTFLTRLVPQTEKAEQAMESLGLASLNTTVAQKALAEEGIKGVKNFGNYGQIEEATRAHFAHSLGLETSSEAVKKAANDFLWSSGVMDSAFLDSKGNFEDLDEIAGALKGSLKGLSDEERTKALNTIFGADATRAANVLAKEGEAGLSKLTKATSDQSAAEKQAAANMKGTAGALEALSGSFETVQLQFGKFIQPAVVAFLNGVTEALNGIVPMASKIGGVLEGMFAGMGEGGAGPLEQLSASFNNVRDAVGPVIEEVGNFIRALLPTITELGQKLVGVLLPGISSIADSFAANFLPAIQKLLPILQPVAKFLLQMFGEALIGAIRGAIQAIKGVIDVVSGVVNLVVSLITGDWAGAWDALKQIVSGAVNLIVGLLRVWWNVGILQLFRKGILFLTKGLWTGLWNGLKTGAQKGMALISTWIGKGLSALRGLFMKGVKAYLGLWTSLFKFLGGIASNAFKVLRSAFGGFVAAVRGIIADLAGGIRSVVGGIASFVVNAVKAIPGKLLALGSRFLDVGKKIIGKFVDGLKNAGGVVSGIAGNVWTAVRGLINGAIDKINAALEFTIDIPGPNITINPPNIPKLARGTDWFAGGGAWVGEEGPEFVSLPRGSKVHTNRESMELAGRGGPGGAAVYIGTVMAHNYRDFTKQLEQQAQLASLGGRRPVAVS